MKLALAVAVIAFAPIQTGALTGSELYRFCGESSKGSVQYTSCIGYVRGFVDGMAMGTAAASNGVKVCLPDDGMDVEQGRLILEKYMREHPEELHKEAGLPFGAALIDAFRCRAN